MLDFKGFTLCFFYNKLFLNEKILHKKLSFNEKELLILVNSSFLCDILRGGYFLDLHRDSCRRCE